LICVTKHFFYCIFSLQFFLIFFPRKLPHKWSLDVKNFNENLTDFSLIYRLELFIFFFFPFSCVRTAALFRSIIHTSKLQTNFKQKKCFFCSSEQRNYYCFSFLRQKKNQKKKYNEERLLRERNVLAARAREDLKNWIKVFLCVERQKNLAEDSSPNIFIFSLFFLAYVNTFYT
jgi:hypothetical protein